ncbi:hypothetical protein ScPMuIL_004843 [Solemya velum]
MSRNYKRKTDRQSWSADAMASALKAVENGQMGYLKAAKQFDVSYMKPLSTYYTQEVECWLKQHPDRYVTVFQLANLFGKAYLKSATALNAANGFRKTGIYPMDRNIFQDHEFAPASVTETFTSGDDKHETSVATDESCLQRSQPQQPSLPGMDQGDYSGEPVQEKAQSTPNLQRVADAEKFPTTGSEAGEVIAGSDSLGCSGHIVVCQKIAREKACEAVVNGKIVWSCDITQLQISGSDPLCDEALESVNTAAGKKRK